jgi:hypothetical protein
MRTIRIFGQPPFRFANPHTLRERFLEMNKMRPGNQRRCAVILARLTDTVVGEHVWTPCRPGCAGRPRNVTGGCTSVHQYFSAPVNTDDSDRPFVHTSDSFAVQFFVIGGGRCIFRARSCSSASARARSHKRSPKYGRECQIRSKRTRALTRS